MPDFAQQATDRLSQNFGTNAQLQAIRQMFAGLIGSQGGQAQLAAGSRAGSIATNALMTQLGRTGGSGTGIGRIAAGVGQAGASIGRSNAQGQIFNQAQGLGTQNLLARLQALPGFAQQLQSQGQGFDFMKLLTDILGGVSLGGAAKLMNRPKG